MLRRLVRGAVWSVSAILIAIVAILGTFGWLADRREIRRAADVAPAGGRFVKAGDVEIFVQESGPEGGPVALFMHGTGAWSETWRESMSALAAEGIRAVALDLPPFGYSERPPGPSYSRTAQARRIIGVLDALGARRALLIGHSFGCGATVEAALLAPDRVRALILVDAALGIAADGAGPASPSALLSGLLRIVPLRDALVATFLTNPAFTHRLLKAFVADPAAATPARVAVYQRPLVIQGTTHAVGQWLPELVAPPAPSLSEDPAAYQSLTMPVTAIWGARDTVTPLDQGERLVRLAPSATLKVLPAAGHIPQIESPGEFNRVLVEAAKAMIQASEAAAPRP